MKASTEGSEGSEEVKTAADRCGGVAGGVGGRFLLLTSAPAAVCSQRMTSVAFFAK